MKTLSYDNYFKDHYKVSFTNADIAGFKNWFTPQWNYIQTKITIKNSAEVLEVGSAVGGFYNLLQGDNPPKYTGIELDKKAVQFANKFFDTSVFKATALEALKTTIQYDNIFAFEVLEHLQDPLLCIDKIYNLLKSDGVFVGTTPYPFEKNVLADDTHLYVLHPENWKRLFSHAGFTQIETYPMSFPPFLWRIHHRLNIRLPFYIAFPNVISTTLIIARK
jgi:SAM-dependent methyltransferase